MVVGYRKRKENTMGNLYKVYYFRNNQMLSEIISTAAIYQVRRIALSQFDIKDEEIISVKEV